MPRPLVFLSYCHADTKPAKKLRDDLTAAGIDVWWDKRIRPGHDWEHEIRTAMKRADYVVLCLSSAATQRRTSGIYPEAQDAISAYRERRPGEIYIIPVRFDPCEIPPIRIDGTRTLDRIQYVDLFPSHLRKKRVQSIVNAIFGVENADDISGTANTADSRESEVKQRPDPTGAVAEHSMPRRRKFGYRVMVAFLLGLAAILVVQFAMQAYERSRVLSHLEVVGLYGDARQELEHRRVQIDVTVAQYLEHEETVDGVLKDSNPRIGVSIMAVRKGVEFKEGTHLRVSGTVERISSGFILITDHKITLMD